MQNKNKDITKANFQIHSLNENFKGSKGKFFKDTYNEVSEFKNKFDNKLTEIEKMVTYKAKQKLQY